MPADRNTPTAAEKWHPDRAGRIPVPAPAMLQVTRVAQSNDLPLRSRLVAKTRTYNEDIRIRHTSKMDVSKLLIFGNSLHSANAEMTFRCVGMSRRYSRHAMTLLMRCLIVGLLSLIIVMPALSAADSSNEQERLASSA